MSKNTVTMKDLWDAISRLEDKIDERFEPIEHRIYNIESYQNKMLGIVSVFAAFVSVAAAYIWNKIVSN